MTIKFSDIRKEYILDENLKEEYIDAIIEWADNQPHLPTIHEIQAIALLKISHYRINAAKYTIGSYFSLKNIWTDLLSRKNLRKPPLKGITDSMLITFLPTRTLDGHKLLLMKILNTDIVNYDAKAAFKYLDIVILSDLYQNGTCSYVIIFDAERFLQEFVAKLDWMTFKRYFYYMQEILPQNFKGLHFINPPSFFHEAMRIVEIAAPKIILSQIYVHQTLDDFDNYVPRKILPKEYGGPVDSIGVLIGKSKKDLLKLDGLLEWENRQMVNENRRLSYYTEICDFENRVKDFLTKN